MRAVAQTKESEWVLGKPGAYGTASPCEARGEQSGKGWVGDENEISASQVKFHLLLGCQRTVQSSEATDPPLISSDRYPSSIAPGGKDTSGRPAVCVLHA